MLEQRTTLYSYAYFNEKLEKYFNQIKTRVKSRVESSPGVKLSFHNGSEWRSGFHSYITYLCRDNVGFFLLFLSIFDKLDEWLLTLKWGNGSYLFRVLSLAKSWNIRDKDLESRFRLSPYNKPHNDFVFCPPRSWFMMRMRRRVPENALRTHKVCLVLISDLIFGKSTYYGLYSLLDENSKLLTPLFINV